MLTRDGWLLLAGAAALIAVGRFFAVFELFVAGAGLVALLVVALLRVLLTRLEVGVSREVHPPRVHAGSPSRVDLVVVNRGSRPTPVLRLIDPVSGTRGADLGIGPLGPGESATASYRLPTARRGRVEVGPLELAVTDPFGLTRLTLPAAEHVELTVYPRVEPLEPLPETTGHDPEAATDVASSLGRSGEEFSALRPYVIGDELRRVHWPSSARFDELLVRQTEVPWQGRATVLLDVRADTHTEDSLDRAVSIAASILAAIRRGGDLVRLVSTDGTDSGTVVGNAQFAASLEYLALVGRSRSAGMARVVDGLARSADGGALVVITARRSREDAAHIAGLERRYRSVTTVVVERSSWDPGTAPEVVPAPSLAEIHVTAAQPFGPAWDRAMRTAGPRRARRTRVAP